jgi:hypothetical protein
MGALGSEAAIETADVVIMQDSPLKWSEAITLARKTRRLVWQNILLALGVKGIFIVLGRHRHSRHVGSYHSRCRGGPDVRTEFSPSYQISLFQSDPKLGKRHTLRLRLNII